MGFMDNMKKLTQTYNGKDVEKAVIVGVRTAADTKLLATYNYGMYSILVKYTDGEVELVEERLDSHGMKVLVKHMEI